LMRKAAVRLERRVGLENGGESRFGEDEGKGWGARSGVVAMRG
jgi:hypothetical protein